MAKNRFFENLGPILEPKIDQKLTTNGSQNTTPCWNNVLLFFKSIWEELNLEKSLKSAVLASIFEVFGLASPQLFGVTKTAVLDPMSDAFLLQKSIRKVSEK